MCHGGACPYIWTPFSDEDSEGSFLNMNSLAKAKLKLWAKGQPNVGIDENFVGIRISSARLIDRPQTALSCSSCLISSLLLLQLDGRCKYFLISNAIFKEGVEQKPKPKLRAKSKLVPAGLGYKKYRHTGHNFHAESRKNIFFLYIYSKSERRKSKRKKKS